jgi:antitoxin HicB
MIWHWRENAKGRAMSKKHMGSGIDEFLKEEGIFDERQAQAVKEVVAWQLAEAGKRISN